MARLRLLALVPLLSVSLVACGDDPEPDTPDAETGEDAASDAADTGDLAVDASADGATDIDAHDAEAGDAGDVAPDLLDDTPDSDDDPDAADAQPDTQPDVGAAVCGDGALQPGETCDDGNRLDGDGCDPWCRVPRCVPGQDSDGDGIDNCDDRETCDGIDNNGDGLIDNALSEAGAACGDAPPTGQCRPGRLECRNGELVCIGQIGPRAELCNGLDDNCDGEVPDDEAACGAWIGTPPDGDVERTLDVALPVRPLDVVLHVDATTSMTGTLQLLRGLADAGAPWRWSPVDDVAWALVTHEDFPFAGRSDPRATPHRLLSRITTSRSAIGNAFAMLRPLSGGDAAEPWDVSLWRIATGGMIRATLVGSPTADALPPLTPVAITADGVDFGLSLDSPATLAAEVFANRLGIGSDTELLVLDRDGRAIAAVDDSVRLDPAIRIRLGAGSYTIRVRGCCGGAGDVAGLAVTVNTTPWIVDPIAVCGSTAAERMLQAIDSVWPIASPACSERCTTQGPPGLVEAFCGAGRSFGVCGDGRLDWGEDCDDGNRNPADGCGTDCRFETFTMSPWLPGVGFSDGLGHGALGGVGFRAGAARVVLHVGDATAVRTVGDPSPNLVSPSRSFAATLPELVRNAGIAFAGVWTGAGELGLNELRAMADATGAWAPPCAFEGSLARRDGLCADDECCTGPFGTGVTPVDGRCPLLFETNGDADVDATLEQALAATATWRSDELTVALEPAGACAVAALRVEVESGRCASVAAAEDRDGDGVDELVHGVRPGDILRFTASLRGNGETGPEGCVPAAAVDVTVRDLSGDLTTIPLLVEP